MLFSSVEFIFYFMPVCLAGFFLLPQRHRLLWLVLASCAFYAWWNPPYLFLLVGWVAVNFLGGRLIAASGERRWRRGMLIALVTANLGVLAYFKYLIFFTDVVRLVFGDAAWFESVFLPLGISFITFQQIIYLVDVHRGAIVDRSFRNFVFFTVFFPQLLAGPIVYYSELGAQLRRRSAFLVRHTDLLVGFAAFAIGLFKKLALADGLAAYADPVFAAAAAGQPIGLFDAWGAALAFTFQVYFDFSGYTDMAVGLARMFGFKLPVNFNSPYKSRNLVEFWQRWHITLLRMLVTYIYTPLALRFTRSSLRLRRGAVATFLLAVALPSMATMLLSGFWHGAGWSYILFGLFHGLALLLVQAWRVAKCPSLPAWAGWTLTMLALVSSFVLFRAADLEVAGRIYAGMAGQLVPLPPQLQGMLGGWANGADALGITLRFGGAGLFEIGAFARDAAYGIGLILLSLAICLLFPNTTQLLRRYAPVTQPRFGWKGLAHCPVKLSWRATPSGVALAALAVLLALLNIDKLQEFIYFQF